MTNKPDSVASTARLGDITDEGLEVFAPYLMNRILRRYNARVETDVRAAGLSVPRLRVLAALAARGPSTINDLAVLAVSEQSSISRLIDQMQTEGLIMRKVSDGDSRVRIVSLTDLGRQRFQDVFPAMQEAEAEMMTGISDQDRQHFLTTLRTVLANVRQNDV